MNQETMNVVITAVVVPVLAALVPLLISFISAKTGELKQRTNSEKLNKYIDIAEDAVETAVVSVFQTYVEALKKEGKFDEAAQKIAFNEAKYKAVTIMGEAAREALQLAYGDLDQWLENKVEYYVKLNK